MVPSSTRYRAALFGATVASGTQLLFARQAIAHTDRYKTEETEQTNSLTDSEQPTFSSEPATAPEESAQKAALPQSTRIQLTQRTMPYLPISY
ncbi:MAG: hypothetical protein WA949_14185 [Phormidesmis sp.]